MNASTFRLNRENVNFRYLRFLILLLLALFATQNASACDTSPVITASNVQNIGGGFYTVNVQVCAGTGGSQDGFNITMGCGLSITATNQATLTNSGKVAVASISGGVLTYTYTPVPPTSWWENNDGIAGPCFNMVITVNGNPEGCTVTTTGVNDGCLIISTSWSTTIPGPCIPNFTMTAPGSQSGNTTGGGNTCTTRASQDHIIAITVPCSGTWTFSLCGGSSWDTYLYLETACCAGILASNDDGCGVQSTITSVLTPGLYYVIVEAFGSSTTGSYTLNVSSALPCVNLPVEMISFDGIFNETTRSNHLSWATATELNNDYFEVERSLDGTNFSVIGEVDGAGNSLDVLNYEFVDLHPVADQHYYRLRQVDLNGEFEYSPVVFIHAPLNSDSYLARVYPNPSSETVTIEVNGDKHERTLIEIYSQDMKLISSDLLPESTSTLMNTYRIDGLEQGVYMIAVTNGAVRELHKLTVIR